MQRYTHTIQNYRIDDSIDVQVTGIESDEPTPTPIPTSKTKQQWRRKLLQNTVLLLQTRHMRTEV